MSGGPEVIVVGAGIVGASVAWHLAEAGARVTVVDGAGPGGIATANSFAWINAAWGNPEPYFRLRRRAMAEWRRLDGLLPALHVRWTGGLCWDLGDAELDAYARQHAGWGYGIREVDAREIRAIEPSLAAPPGRALHVAEEAAVEPREAALALLDDALGRGLRLRAPRAAERLTVEGGRIVGIETGEGPMRADEVVVASGAGTARLLSTAGIDLPMSTPPGLLMHSRPHGPLLNGIVVAPHLHMRQTAAGRLVAGAHFGGADPGTAPAEAAAVLFDAVRTALVGGGDLALERYTVGHRPTPEGGFPAVGRVGGRAGLYVAVMHSGVTLAPAVGLLAAEEIVAGRRDPVMAPYGPRATAA